MRSRPLGVGLLGAILVACGSYNVPDPVAGGFPTLEDTLQSAAESLAYNAILDDKYTFFSEDIDVVFRAHAGMEFWYHYSADSNNGHGWLDAPAAACGYSAGQWPPVTCGTFYYDYAEMRRDQHWPFAVFTVNHLVTTDTTFCNPSWVGGVSNKPDPTQPGRIYNTIPTHRRERFSFFFMLDLDAITRRCAVTARSVLTFVWVHELGHQRAGLSHNVAGYDPIFGGDLKLAYHNGNLHGQIDVMLSQIDIHDMARNTYPFFDSYDSVRTNDTTSCGGNLFRARSMH